MPTHFIPKDHFSISPFLIVKDAEKEAQFLKDAFTGVEISRLVSPQGGIVNLVADLYCTPTSRNAKSDWLPSLKSIRPERVKAERS